MSVIFLLPILPPQRPAAEALSQEIELLRNHFGGELVYVNPNAHLPRTLIPRLGFGWHKLPQLYDVGRDARLFHFFNPDPFPYPFLLTLPKPVVYTITSGVATDDSITSGIAARPNIAYLRRMASVTVPDERSLLRLQELGLTNVALQTPGIATHRFKHHPLPLTIDEPLHLLVASAPWTVEQLTSKGFGALLAAAQIYPNLHLTLLWRGQLVTEIRRMITQMGLNERVTLIDQTVDMDAMLAGVHATAIFATKPGIIKSYPHSLLDSLAAGKPVLLNSIIPMSDYVKDKKCGVVINNVSPQAIIAGIDQLRDDYALYAINAEFAGQRDFTEEAALRAVTAIYAKAEERVTRRVPEE